MPAAARRRRVDCSGLASWSYAQIGIRIPNGTAGQWPQMRTVEQAQIKPGDLIFFAIGGKMFWLLGLCMAGGAMLGGWIGSHTAMRFGARLIRPLLVLLSFGLTARLLWSYFSA